jgi:hypothetical protein
MRRSFGVTFSAVIVLLGSGLTVLFSALAALGPVLGPASSHRQNLPPAAGLMLAFIYLLFAGWGIATGVGLIQLRRWARISLLVFNALLLFISIPTILVMMIIPFPGVNSPDLPENFALYMRIGIAVFYGMVAVMAAAWMYFFTRKSVKDQFLGAERPLALGTEPLVAPAGGVLLPESTQRNDSYDGSRMAMRVIGAFLLLGAFAVPFMMIFYSSMAHGAPFPALFLGYIFMGPRAVAVLLLYAGISAVAAIGLLRLRPWSRSLAIGLQIFALINLVVTFATPGSRERYAQFMEATMASMQGAAEYQPTMNFAKSISWFSLLFSVPVIAVILWLLITRKQAFLPAAEKSASFD